MVKRGILLLLIISLLASFIVIADLGINQHTPLVFWWVNDATTSSYSQYESSSNVGSILISTLSSPDSLTNFSIDYLGIQSITPSTVQSPFSDLIVDSGSQNITFNISSSLLGLNLTPLSVNSDTSFTWYVKTTDSTKTTKLSTLTLTVKNDSIAPRYVLNSPANYTLLKNVNTVFNISITEEESGLNTADMVYNYDNTVPFAPGIVGVSALSNNNGFYTFNYDLNTVITGGKKYFGFYFNLTDKASNVNQQKWHYIYVDSELPTVTLTSPSDNYLTNIYTQNYGFNAGDNAFGIDNNFQPQLSCSLYVDGIVKNSTTLTSNSSVSLGTYLSLTDGSYSWYTSCTDSAGWINASLTRTFILDTTGPVIALNSPANNSVIANGTIISLNVSDTAAGVHSVWYSLDNGANNYSLTVPYNIDTAESFQAESNSLTVFANDSLSNVAQYNFVFVVDVNAPAIDLSYPANSIFANSTFVLSASDNHALAFSCSLKIDGEVKETKNTASGAELRYSYLPADGSYAWNVNCTDGFGNLNTSTSRTVKFDNTLPAISLEFPINSNNYSLSNVNTNGASNFNYRLTDINPHTCVLEVDKVEKNSVAAGSNFSSINFSSTPQNAISSWNITCNDSAGNIKTSSLEYVYYDTVLPIISSVLNSSITYNSATISWSVDEYSNQTLFYGTNSSDLSSSLKAEGITLTPAITVNSLSASTVYYYVVQSCDQFNNCLNYSSLSFTTLEAPASPAASGGGGGGGGGGSKVTEEVVEVLTESTLECSPNWKCGEWSSCENGERTRFCQDQSLCGLTENKPEEKESCQVSENSESTSSENTPGANDLAGEDAPSNTGNLITGQAIGVFESLKTDWIIYALITGMTVLIAGFAWFKPNAGSLHKITHFRQIRREKEEEMVRQKL